MRYLDNLVASGLLKAEAPAASVLSGLIRTGVARLADAGNGDRSLEARFDLADNSAHALSMTALRISGYRPTNRYPL